MESFKSDTLQKKITTDQFNLCAHQKKVIIDLSRLMIKKRSQSSKIAINYKVLKYGTT